VRRFWQMEVDLDDARQGAVAPPGIRLDALDPVRDLPAAHRILEEAFADHWDYTPTEYEEFLEQNVHQDDFDPGLWIVASEAGEPVAVLCGSARADRGIVEMLGVLRSHRGRGIASALLGDAFAEFARRGLARARLNVDSDNPTGAVSLYERMGMRVVSSYDLWSRIIEPGGPDG
jgi:mycothiol synthase